MAEAGLFYWTTHIQAQDEYLKTFYPWRTPLSLCQSLTEGTKKLKCASQMPSLESERAPKSIGALGENVRNLAEYSYLQPLWCTYGVFVYISAEIRQ